MSLSLFPVKCVRLCTYLCGLVHFSYLLLCISPWLRVSIYYDTMRRHTYVRCFGLNSALSSHFYYFSSSSTTFFSFVTSFLPPTRQLFPSQHIFTQIHLPFHWQHPPTPLLCFSTTLSITFCFITCSPLFLSFFCLINFHISLSHLKLAATHAYTTHQFNMHITFPYFRFYQRVYLPTSFYHYHG